MPANLNALIRYKTINGCLYGGKRWWTVRELRNACSEALAESRGRYEPVSERTLRDDIRVMRSDILGFNAPILQKAGLYYYGDPNFSILTLNITDAGLAEKILEFLTMLRAEVKHPELETILEQLCNLTGKPYEFPVLSAPADSGWQEKSTAKCLDLSLEQSDSKFPASHESFLTNRSRIRFSVRDIQESDVSAERIKKEENLFITTQRVLSWGGIFARIT
jgi:hypothetical protein